MVHVLKCVQPFLDQIIFGKKRFEVRKFDRSYAIGDTVLLVEYSPVKEVLSPKFVLLTINYFFWDSSYLSNDMCVFGFDLVYPVL